MQQTYIPFFSLYCEHDEALFVKKCPGETHVKENLVFVAEKFFLLRELPLGYSQFSERTDEKLFSADSRFARTAHFIRPHHHHRHMNRELLFHHAVTTMTRHERAKKSDYGE